MALDRNDSHTSSSDGVVIIPQRAMLDAFIIDQIIRKEEDQRRNTHDRVGIAIPGFGEEMPEPPRRPVYDDRMTDEDGEDRGYCEIDM